MKKRLGLVLVLVVCLLLVGCGAKQSSTGSNGKASSESVAGTTWELYKTNYGEEKTENLMEVIYTFNSDGSVDVKLGGSRMNKPYTQEGAKVSIDFGDNGGIEELELIDGELVKDLGYGTEHFKKQ